MPTYIVRDRRDPRSAVATRSELWKHLEDRSVLVQHSADRARLRRLAAKLNRKAGA